MKADFDRSVLTMAVACAVVGVLAARGTFNSMRNFPLVFSAVCVVFSALRLWHGRAQRPVALSALVLVAGVALAIAGWVYQRREIAERRADRRTQILERIEGREVPALPGLDPLNTDQRAWDSSAMLEASATIVIFWARWCSPCWKEMDELEEIYRQHRDSGLAVAAVTRYDTPDDQDRRESDFVKAKKFLENRGITYPAAITDRDDLYRAYLTSYPPSTFLVDHEGKVLDYGIGLESVRILFQKAIDIVGTTAP